MPRHVDERCQVHVEDGSSQAQSHPESGLGPEHPDGESSTRKDPLRTIIWFQSEQVKINREIIMFRLLSFWFSYYI